MRFLKILLLVLALCGAQNVQANTDEPLSPDSPEMIMAKEAFKAGESAYRRKEYQNAIYAFQRSTQYNPQNYEAYCMLGLMYLLNNEIKRGLNMLTYATQVFPQNGYAFALLGDYYHTQNKIQQALQSYQTAIDLTMPIEQKTKYTKRLDEVLNSQKEKLNLQTSAAKSIIKSVQLNAGEDWSVDHAENTDTYWKITYKYKDEDLLSDKWTQKITLQCYRNKTGKKSFKELFKEITTGYMKNGMSISNTDPGFRSGSFTTSHKKNRSVVYVHTHGRDLCVSEREKQDRWQLNEPGDWLVSLQKITIADETEEEQK